MVLLAYVMMEGYHKPMSTAQHFLYTPGTVPVLISMPHTATFVPDPILARFTDPAKRLPDTDWYIDRLYAFARDLGCHMLAPTYSRYVVDLNRGPDNASLYPGKFTTGICPLTMFDGAPIYREGEAPDAVEITQRIADYWQPYHHQLQSVIAELKERHGRVILFDAHSISSQLPLLFEGVLPDLNIGTADGVSAEEGVCEKLLACARRSSYSVVYNGRFKGGYITRHYGHPAQDIHVVQLELTQRNYMEEHYPFHYDTHKAARLQAVLREMLSVLIE